MAQTGQVTNRGKALMRRISETSFYVLKAEVEAMPPEEARKVWGLIEPLFPGVCARASLRKRDLGWLMLLKKIDLYRKKAQED